VTPHNLLEAILLAGIVASCWIGVIGMLRMRVPMQALDYLSLPACSGSILLVAAVFVHTGSSSAAWKTVAICLVLLAINSIVIHATARALRSRESGYWKLLPGDGAEFVPAGSRGPNYRYDQVVTARPRKA
jgi:multisubunit Na+/H+ antiporter MnhG subunit